jgi:hypothetical protein
MAPSAASDQRSAVRFEASLPVALGGARGETHNISAHGIYFETDVQQRVGQLLNFSLEYTLHGRTHRLLCEGKVVRVEPQGRRVGVAARLVAPFFDGTEDIAL